MGFVTVKAIATNSFPSNITPSRLLLCCIVTIFSENKNHFWSNEMGNEGLIALPKASWSPWRRIRSWCCRIYPAEEDTGKRQMQTRAPCTQHSDTQSGNGVGTPCPEDQQTFFQPLVQRKVPTRLHPGPVCSTQLMKWGKTSAASAPPPGWALVHLAGSWEPAEEPLFEATVCLGYLGERH